jgi:phospholipase A1
MKLLFILLLFLNTTIYASIQSYQDTYFITGNNANQAKYQISFKYNLWSPYGTGFLAYTQLAHWDVYDQSSPFKDINHNPAIFWEKENIWFDYLRVAPYSHSSNGKDKEDSRSIESGFIQFKKSIDICKILNVGIDEKYTHFYKLSNKNHDYRRYKGNFRTELFMQLKYKGDYSDQEKIYIVGEWTHKSYFIEYGIMLRILVHNIQPKLYLQGYYGTGEFLLNYKEKTKAVRAGFIFSN